MRHCALAYNSVVSTTVYLEMSYNMTLYPIQEVESVKEHS